MYRRRFDKCLDECLIWPIGGGQKEKFRPKMAESVKPVLVTPALVRMRESRSDSLGLFGYFKESPTERQGEKMYLYLRWAA